MSDTLDRQLMAKIIAGDKSFLAGLFERYHASLWRFFWNLTGHAAEAEDLHQEVFVRVLKYAHSFDPNQSFRIWLFQVARNVYRDHYKQSRKYRYQELEQDMTTSAESPEDRLHHRQQKRLLHRALAQLSPENREVLVLSRFEGLKYHEMAQVLDCTVTAIKGRVYRAMRHLREIYAALSHEEHDET